MKLYLFLIGVFLLYILFPKFPIFKFLTYWVGKIFFSGLKGSKQK
jgi:hypothetical protein